MIIPKKIFLGLLGVGCIFLLHCTKTPSEATEENSFRLDLPNHFPEVPSPSNNSLSEKRIEMGRYLFYETALSKDSSLSCGSCHIQEAAFADHHAISVGIAQRIGNRNVPTLANIGYHPYLFAEGGSPSLEMQMIGPINSESELGFNTKKLIERLEKDPFYDSLSQTAYGRKMDLFTLTRSIGAFQRSILSGNAPYDQYLNGDSSALAPQQIKGMKLFFSDKWACKTCHSGHLLSNFSFENIGLYKVYPDKGRILVSMDSLDEGKFKVPSLRNIALTYPYMHDGSLASLEEVIEHYNTGGKGHHNQHPSIRPLHMTEEEKKQLLAFFTSLTDSTMLSNPAYQKLIR